MYQIKYITQNCLTLDILKQSSQASLRLHVQHLFSLQSSARALFLGDEAAVLVGGAAEQNYENFTLQIPVLNR